MTILVLSRFASDLAPILTPRLPDRAGPGSCTPGDALRCVFADSYAAAPDDLSDVEIVLTFQVPRGLPERLPRLRWVSATGAGVDRILAAGLAPHVQVTRMIGMFGRPLGEYTLSAILAHAQRHTHAAALQRGKRFAPYEVDGIAGRVAGILGAGSIGQDIGALLRAAGTETIGLRRSGAPAHGVTRMFAPAGLHEFLAFVDYLVVVAPLTDETRGMLGRAEFAVMRPHESTEHPEEEP